MTKPGRGRPHGSVRVWTDERIAQIRDFRAKIPPWSWAQIGLFFGVTGDQARMALIYDDKRREAADAARSASGDAGGS